MRRWEDAKDLGFGLGAASTDKLGSAPPPALSPGIPSPAPVAPARPAAAPPPVAATTPSAAPLPVPAEVPSPTDSAGKGILAIVRSGRHNRPDRNAAAPDHRRP